MDSRLRHIAAAIELRRCSFGAASSILASSLLLPRLFQVGRAYRRVECAIDSRYSVEVEPARLAAVVLGFG